MLHLQREEAKYKANDYARQQQQCASGMPKHEWEPNTIEVSQCLLVLLLLKFIIC